MAGLAGRMSTVVKAKVSKMLDRAEDPAETLDYSYQKQLELLQNVKKGIADVVTAKKRLQMQESTRCSSSVVKLDTQARQALAAGHEDLARARARAQERRPDRAAGARHAGHRTRDPAAEADRLRDSSCARRSRPSAPRRRSSRRSTPPPRRRCGSPRRRPAWASRWPTSAWRCSARVDKTENMKARADAVRRARSGRHLRRHHPARLRRRRHRPSAQGALEPGGAVDDELAKMKSELGRAPAPRRLRSPRGESAPAGESGQA